MLQTTKKTTMLKTTRSRPPCAGPQTKVGNMHCLWDRSSAPNSQARTRARRGSRGAGGAPCPRARAPPPSRPPAPGRSPAASHPTQASLCGPRQPRQRDGPSPSAPRASRRARDLRGHKDPGSTDEAQAPGPPTARLPAARTEPMHCVSNVELHGEARVRHGHGAGSWTSAEVVGPATPKEREPPPARSHQVHADPGGQHSCDGKAVTYAARDRRAQARSVRPARPLVVLPWFTCAVADAVPRSVAVRGTTTCGHGAPRWTNMRTWA